MMKKRLEAELISIAHRILKLKNKSEVGQLHEEARKLYETLSVLKFYQDNFELVKHDVNLEVLEEKLSQKLEVSVQSEIVVEENEIENEPTAEITNVVENDDLPVINEESVVGDSAILSVADESFEDNDVNEEEDHEDHEGTEVPVFKPVFELGHIEEDEVIEEKTEITEAPVQQKTETKQVYIDELLGKNYSDPVFVKPNEVTLFSSSQTEEEKPKSVILNDTLSKSIDVGLNDKIAFVKHLFGNSTEDFNRVISQLNTFDNYEEAKNFINEMVIPDYNYWVGEEEYLQRFMEMVEKKFL